MRAKLLLLILLIGSVGFLSHALPKDNYATDACTQLVTKANALYNKGKYAEAKLLYEKALSTGDRFFAKKCTEQLRYINTILDGKKKSTSTVFTISQDTVTINHLGGDYPIHVNGDNWHAFTPNSEDWCKIEVNRKTGIVKIYSTANETTESRTTTVTIKNGNGQQKTVKVINQGSPEILRSSAQSLMFTPTGETNIVDIDANTEWHLSDVPTWLKATKGNGDIQFTATANDGNKDRIAQVKVETPTKQEITINIFQGAKLDSLAFSKNNLQFGPEGGDEYIHVLTDAEDWRFGSFPHWCQLERINGNTIKVHCTPNEPVDMPREASVNVTTGNQTLGINVFQDPKPMVQVIPTDGIGGRKVSFGFAAGYALPMISTSASSRRILSPVNYAQGPDWKSADYKSSGGFNVGAFVDIRAYKNLYVNAGLEFLYYTYRNEYDNEMNLVLSETSKYYLQGVGLGSFKEDYTMMALEVPILASYRIPLNSKSHIRINAGPVFDFGLSAKLNLAGRTNCEELKAYKIVNGLHTDLPYDNATYRHHVNYSGNFDLYSDKAELTSINSYANNLKVTSTEELESAPYNRINMGLRFGVGYEFMGISLSLSYQWMITNSANDSYWRGTRWPIFRNNDEYRMTGYKQNNNLLLVTLGYTLRY